MVIRGLLYLGLVFIFLRHPTWYTTGKDQHLNIKLLIFVSGVSVAGTIIPYLSSRFHWPNLLRRIALTLLVIGGPLGIFQMIEYVHKRGITSYPKVMVLYNYVLILALFLLLFILVNRIRTGLFLTFLCLMIFSLINYYVYDFRGEPILAADIYDIGTAAGVAAAYQFILTVRVFWSLFCIPSFMALLAFIPGEQLHPRGRYRLLTTLLALVIACPTIRLFAMTDYMRDQGNKLKMFESYGSYRKYGELLTMTWSFRYIMVDKPAGYSPAKLQEEVASRYTSDPVRQVTEVTEETPNLIFIMNESFADMELIGDMGYNEDPIPFIHSLKGKDNVIWGNLYTEGYGGKTANTEYEVMTGNSMAFLPNACVAYTVFVKNELPTMNWNLSDMGYSGCYGYHPYKGSGYRRNTVYPMLGFQNSLFLEDMEAEITEDDLLRGYVTDSCDYRWLIRTYEETRKDSKAPFYMYNVTMQNHGSYTLTDDKMKMPITLRPELQGYDKANLYTNLLPYTDRAMKELVEYFEGVEEPTILVFYGDHQPGLTPEFLTDLTGIEKFSKELIFKKYQVPIILWANYDINPGGIHDEEFAMLSTNYLAPTLMNMLGYPMTGYQKYLLDLSKELPIISLHGHLAADGTYINLDDKDTPYSDRINEYNALVYNLQMDSRHWLKDFFELKK